jgi:hypothetical protein
MVLDYSELASPEQGSGFRDSRLIASLKIFKRIEAKLGILIVAEFETVKAALPHVVKLVAQHVAYSPDLSLVGILLP